MTDQPASIVGALVAFQAELPRIPRTSQAQYGKYADLGEVAAAVLPRLAAHGICYTTQLVRDLDGGWLLNGDLRHVSGETIGSSWPIPTGGPQLMGGIITYARRYMLLALSGVHPAGEDDDAQDAQRTQDQQRRDDTQPDETLDRMRRAMFAQLAAAGIPRDLMREEIAHIIGRELTTSSDLSAEEVSEVLDTLRARRGAARQETP